MNKTVVIVSIMAAMVTASFAEQKTLSSKEQVARIQEQKSGGGNVVSETVSLKDSSLERGGVDNYRDAVLAKYIDRNLQKTVIPTPIGKRFVILTDNVKILEEENKNKNRGKTSEKKEIEEESFYTSGYCSTLNTIDVSELVSFAELECMLDGIGNAKLSVQIYPQHSAKALIGKPIYVVPDGNSNVRYNVQSGVLLNGLRTGLNIASIVNDRKIERMLAAGMLSTNSIVSEQSLKYMNALEESRQQEGSQVIPGTGGSAPIVVQNKNTQRPEMQDYIAVAGIKLASSIVGIVGESMINNLPYLYRIERGQRFYFDGQLIAASRSRQSNPLQYTNRHLVKKSIQNISVDKNGVVKFLNGSKGKDDTNDLQIENEEQTKTSRQR